MNIEVKKLDRNMADEYLTFLIKEHFLTGAQKKDATVSGIIGQTNTSRNAASCRKVKDLTASGIMQKS